MARGRGAGRAALSEAKIGELIRGNKEALQAQAAIGGNAPRTGENIDPISGEVLPPGMLAFSAKFGTYLPAEGATKEQLAYADKLIADAKKTLQSIAPDNTATLATSPDLAQAELDALAKEFAKSQEAEDAFKEYLEGLQTKAEFESEEAAEQARQEAWVRYVRGQQSAAGAAKSASNPKNAQQAKSNPKASEPEGEEAKQAAAEKPWWMSSGSGPRFLFGGQGAGGDVQMSAGGIAERGEAAKASQKELLKRKQARALGGGATPTTPTPPPTK